MERDCVILHMGLLGGCEVVLIFIRLNLQVTYQKGERMGTSRALDATPNNSLLSALFAPANLAYHNRLPSPPVGSCNSERMRVLPYTMFMRFTAGSPAPPTAADKEQGKCTSETYADEAQQPSLQASPSVQAPKSSVCAFG
eukprot:1160093-Pelagomonas_calceolata.AAC.8